MSVFEFLQTSTGLDPFFIANALFFGMVVLIWLVMGVLDQRDRRRVPHPHTGPASVSPGVGSRRSIREAGSAATAGPRIAIAT